MLGFCCYTVTVRASRVSRVTARLVSVVGLELEFLTLSQWNFMSSSRHVTTPLAFTEFICGHIFVYDAFDVP